MGAMRRVAFIVAALATALAGQAAMAAAGTTSRSIDRAVVMVSTPELPAGDGAGARSRWHALRARSRSILDRVADRHGLAVETAIPEIGLLSVELGRNGLPGLRRRLAGDPRVRSVKPDVPVELRFAPNDTAFNSPDANAPGGDLAQWNLLREGAPRAWDLSKGTGAEVAMVDSGVDGGHPDIAPRIVGAQSFGTPTPATSDQIGHGTHTAGLACGNSGNGYGIASMGFRCALFIAKIAIGGSCSNVANAITAAANRNSDVISMSIGACDTGIVPALDYAQSRGSVLVAAGDNVPNPDGSCGLDVPLLDSHDCIYPEEWVQPLGSGPNAGVNRGLVVTSAKYDGTRSSFAEQTSRVSVAAHGSASDSIGGEQGILSTWPGNGVSDDSYGGRTTLAGDNRFAYLVGTSMATPQVAGVAALIRSVRPQMANTRIVRLIKATASHCGRYGDGIGWGIVRADEAVIAALGRDVDPPTSRVRKARRLKQRKRSKGRPVKLRLRSADTGLPHCVKNLPVSGVSKVIVFASANGGRYHRIGKTRRKALVFPAKRHRRYRFYSIAVDGQGNREAPPSVPDAKLKVKR
jgi:subtilisin family serine protease